MDFSHLLGTATMAGGGSQALNDSIARMAAARKRSAQLKALFDSLGGPSSSRALGGGDGSGGGVLTSGGRGGITVGQVSGLSPAEAYIIQRESGGRATAQNPTSTAFGIWQGLQSTRNAYARRFGYNPNTTDVNQQLQMFRAYVRDRYGTAENARRFWASHHWY